MLTRQMLPILPLPLYLPVQLDPRSQDQVVTTVHVSACKQWEKGWSVASHKVSSHINIWAQRGSIRGDIVAKTLYAIFEKLCRPEDVPDDWKKANINSCTWITIMKKPSRCQALCGCSNKGKSDPGLHPQEHYQKTEM